MKDTSSYEAYAAKLHIENGDWDAYLPQIAIPLRHRLMLINPDKPPTRKLPEGQVWAWLNDHWEIVGTGAVIE